MSVNDYPRDLAWQFEEDDRQDRYQAEDDWLAEQAAQRAEVRLDERMRP